MRLPPCDSLAMRLRSMALLLFLLVFHVSAADPSLPRNAGSDSRSGGQKSSVLVALMESPYTEFVEFMGRAGMLERLEKAVAAGRKITILAPRNAYLESSVPAEFKRWLLQPGNVRQLREVLKHHTLPSKITSSELQRLRNNLTRSLSSDPIRLSIAGAGKSKKAMADLWEIVEQDAILEQDGVVHGLDGFLVPRSVQAAYDGGKQDRRSLAVLPQAAPAFDPKAASLAKMNSELLDFLEAEAPLPLELAAPPEMAPAPAPGPSSGKHRIYSWEDVDDFISTLASYGGYGEMAELLVNLTSFAWDMARLVNEGHRLTLLAPNDAAMDEITTEQLNAPGGIEAMLMYHVLTEYQTEESLYNAVRRFDKVSFPSLRTPHTIPAKEADGTVQFGDGALLYDHDIFTDGHLSVQGINKVLVPPESKLATPSTKPAAHHQRGRSLSESMSSGPSIITRSIRELLHL